MTAHCRMEYEYGEPYTQAFVDNIVDCIKYNRGTPMVFAIATVGDALIYNIPKLDKEITKEQLREMELPGEEVTVELIMEVLDKLKG